MSAELRDEAQEPVVAWVDRLAFSGIEGIVDALG